MKIITKADILESLPEKWDKPIISRCDECGKEVDITIQIGEELSYQSSTADICFDCLKNAVKLLDNLR